VLRLTLKVRAISASGSPAANRLSLLVKSELRFAAQLHASGLGALTSFAGSGANQIALELGPPRTVSISRPCGVLVSAHESPSDRKPAFLSVMAAMVFRRSRVDRASRLSLVTSRTSPTSSVAIKSAELRAVRLGAARHFAEHSSGARRPELVHLRVDALTVGRDARVAVNHAIILSLYSATEKPNDFNSPIPPRIS
jgi:hypothetical protein